MDACNEGTGKQQQALDQCEHLRRDFARRADRHKRRYRVLQTISVGLAIATTALAALAASQKLTRVEWVVPLVSGLTALSTTFLTQTNAQRIWIHSRGVSQRFQAEQFLYLQGSGVYGKVRDDSERLKLFSNRIMTIWSQAQEGWSQHVSSGGGS